MSYIVPDPRWEQPALLTPRRKPNGPVVVDFSNKITRGLTRAMLFGSAGSNSLVDLVSGSIFTNAPARGGSPVIGPTDAGEALLCGGPAANEYIVFDVLPTDFYGISSLDNARTVTVVVRVDSISTRGVIFQSNFQDGGSNASYILAEGNQYRFSVDDYNLNYAYIGLSLGEWNVVTGTYFGSTSGVLDIYSDGVKGTSASDTSPGNINFLGVGFGEGFNGTFSRELDGAIASVFVHNRALSESEVIGWHRDVYQFLIPAG